MKRGLSDIVTNVLIILLVLVGIGIVWAGVRPFIDRSAEGASGTECYSIKIEPISCERYPGEVVVTLKRGNEDIKLDELNFVFEQGPNSLVRKNNTLITALETRRYIFNETILENTEKVSVAATFQGKICAQSTPINCGSLREKEFYATTTYAFSWDNPAGTTPNIVPFYWIGARWYGSFVQPNVTDALIEMNRRTQLGIPRVIADADTAGGNFGLIDVLGENSSDYCTTNLGEVFQCIWWNNSAATIKNRYNSFFTNFSQQGGQVDYFVLNYEPGLTSWEIGSNILDPLQQRKWAAIQNDPRFIQEGIAAQLGFNDLTTVHNYSSGQNYMIWNSLMAERKANYINNAAYSILRQFYPNIKLSNYDQYNIESIYYVPDYNGHNVAARSIRQGIVGTSQAPSTYGWLGSISNLRLDGTNFYAKDAFNALRRDLNSARAAHLSSNAPLTPWIPWRSYSDSNTFLNNSDYYQELILHLGLTGTEYFLYWNPSSTHFQVFSRQNQAQEDQLVSTTLQELDQISGFNNKQSLVTSLVGWGDDYIMTGAIAGDKKVYRITPQTTATVNSNTGNVQIQTPTKTITFIQGQVWTPSSPVSSKGYWITQPISAPNPIIN